MLIALRIVFVFSASLIVLGVESVYGQTYPNKPIRIVSSGLGGVADLAARLIASGLTERFGQQVVVDNRAAGVIPGEIVAKAAPDGYTLLLYGTSFWLAPFMRDGVPYDVERDFSPITLAVTTPNIVVVHPSVGVNSIKELITMAKLRPGELNYASAAAGSSSRLAAELFKAMAGVNIVYIAYKGAGAALNDVIGGQVHMSFATAGSVMPHIKSGRLTALAVTSLRPSALAPGLPTVTASGLPGYESSSTQGVFAPAKTPAAVINRLHQEIVQFLNRAGVKEKLFNAGVEVIGGSPKDFAVYIKNDMAAMGKVIKDVGIRSE